MKKDIREIMRQQELRHGLPVERGYKARTAKTYFIQGKITRLIKIGLTIGTVAERLKVLQSTSPDELIVLASIQGDFERAIHHQFREHRAHGEWFKPAPELLKFISLLNTAV